MLMRNLDPDVGGQLTSSCMAALASGPELGAFDTVDTLRALNTTRRCWLQSESRSPCSAQLAPRVLIANSGSSVAGPRGTTSGSWAARPHDHGQMTAGSWIYIARRASCRVRRTFGAVANRHSGIARGSASRTAGLGEWAVPNSPHHAGRHDARLRRRRVAGRPAHRDGLLRREGATLDEGLALVEGLRRTRAAVAVAMTRHRLRERRARGVRVTDQTSARHAARAPRPGMSLVAAALRGRTSPARRRQHHDRRHCARCSPGTGAVTFDYGRQHPPSHSTRRRRGRIHRGSSQYRPLFCGERPPLNGAVRPYADITTDGVLELFRRRIFAGCRARADFQGCRRALGWGRAPAPVRRRAGCDLVARRLSHADRDRSRPSRHGKCGLAVS